MNIELPEIRCDISEYVGPVPAIARVQPCFAVLDTADDPVAVVFDLVDPILSGRSRSYQRGQHRRHFRRQPRRLRAWGQYGACALFNPHGRFWGWGARPPRI